MRRTLTTLRVIVLACCLASAGHATDVDGPNDCTRPNQDFGDAPEGTAVLAYPGVFGCFPTCIAPGPVGVRNVACLPISTVPGPAGFVKHNSAAGAPIFWLGCGAAAPMGVDTETDGKVNNSAILGAPSACSGIPTDCVEAAFGLSFGQDECYGSTDAGVLRPNLRTCKPATVSFSTTNCATAAITVYLNILVDMNHDGDWNDNFQCVGACAYEWAVKNATITLPVGCAALTSPAFLVGPNAGQGWMRVTISSTPVNDDFPWAGSATMGGLQGGETEDYPVVIRKPAVAVLVPADITWATVAPGVVRFHMNFHNDDPDDQSEAATGQIMSQQFGVFMPDYGQIGSFNVPPMAPNSFFDVFVDIAVPELPPSAQEVLPWGGMPAMASSRTSRVLAPGCPPDDHWDGNVDVNWSSPSGGGQVNKHFGTLQVCPAHGNSYIHALVFCNDPAGASWSIAGVCPGWSATLVNEGPPGVPDGPAPNPVPPGWTGFICISADGSVAPGAVCPLTVTFTCNGVDGVIDLQPVACDCTDQLCQIAYEDFGDAPEEIPAYATGLVGHFPTCIFATPPGTPSAFCGPLLGTPPGPTGYVRHVAVATDAAHFWLGCGLPPANGVDSERDGKVAIAAAAGTPSVCDQNVLTDCLEFTSDGLSYGQDECYGDGVDAGIAARIDLPQCGTTTLKFDATNCGSTTVDVFVNVLFDWNQDGDWNDNMPCGALCVHEWTFKNLAITLAPGCNTITLPNFIVGPRVGPSWMRITLTRTPVKNDFPWNGSLGEPNGYFAGGETEDYPIHISPPPAGVNDPTLPSEIRLALQPNPARSWVDVSLALPRESFANVGVYDIAGRNLATLMNGVLPAGEKTFRWNLRGDNGQELPLGLYFVRANVGGRLVTRTVVKIK